MGQYYLAIILGEKDLSKKEIIRIFMDPHNFNNGAKLTEHSYINNNYVSSFEYLLTPEGMFYKSRVVWAGDYADHEESQDNNLYQIVTNEINENKRYVCPFKDTKEYKYIINHTKKEYVDKKNKIFHPLPLLTAEGNGRGGGDYHSKNKELVGKWSRDVISVEKEKPEEYTELICEFSENY
jgi:hypothetical protein